MAPSIPAMTAFSLILCWTSVDAETTDSSAPQPPPGAPEYQAPARSTDGQNMALTIEKLTHGFDPPRPLLIWAIGSSFTQRQGRGNQLIEAIRQRFPQAPPIVYKVMMASSAPDGLTRGHARQLVIPEQPDVVLIYNFGATEDLEKLILELRTRTTADIIVPTLHWCLKHGPAWPDPDAATVHQDPAAMRQLCARHGVEFVENRRDLTKYMLDHNLKIADLLADTVHQSPYAAQIINLNIAHHFRRSDDPASDPRSRERRIEVEDPSSPILHSDDWQPAESGRALVYPSKLALYQPSLDVGRRAWMEVQFTGTRIDLVGWRDPRGGSARILIDGIPGDEVESFYATFVEPDLDNAVHPEHELTNFRRPIYDRAPYGIGLGGNLLSQMWTLTMTSDTGDYELAGTHTGPDGRGNAFQLFTSDSGQIVIEPELWRLAETNRAGDRFTFEVYRCTKGQIDFAGPAERFRVRVAQNLAPGVHTLRLETRGNGPVMIDAFDVFEPPHKPAR